MLKFKNKSGNFILSHAVNIHIQTDGICHCTLALYSVSYQHLRSASRRQLIVPCVRRSTFGSRAFAIAGPTVWNSLPYSLCDPAVGPDQFRRDLKTHLFESHCVSFSTLVVFSRNALYKSTFYLLTYSIAYASVIIILAQNNTNRAHSAVWQKDRCRPEGRECHLWPAYWSEASALTRVMR